LAAIQFFERLQYDMSKQWISWNCPNVNIFRFWERLLERWREWRSGSVEERAKRQWARRPYYIVLIAEGAQKIGGFKPLRVK
jgi:hypothetical protein